MNLIIIGLGYVGTHIRARLSMLSAAHTIWGTHRSPGWRAFSQDVQLCVFNTKKPLEATLLNAVTHILITAPPENKSDTFLEHHKNHLPFLPHLKWIGYMSTTSVYGDHKGAWVTEKSFCNPTSTPGQDRLVIEDTYRKLHNTHGVPVHIFRTSSIYGKGRSVFDRLASPSHQHIYAPGHCFSRIHVDDIARLIVASMQAPTPGEIFNLADKNPAPTHELTEYACALLGQKKPPLTALQNATLSPRMKDFYRDYKRVDGTKIQEILGVHLHYPTYREGLTAIHTLS
ncbi:MAG: NAD-dependent epimerase/dehydratase family protein [Alphaproteobacteria bacterium]|nr:MAG: NAD-dependent epimerase/dehydratase family protein [Alphaproteobacteria bacterium]